MSRPLKCRKVCHIPEIVDFSPTGKKQSKPIILTIDEFETIRLIDREGFSQEECGKLLGIGRTTAQKIYDTARKKIADALVLGCRLKIEGGDYEICDGKNCRFSNFACVKQEFSKKYYKEKGENVMRIAVTYEDGYVGQHFGHTEKFKIFDVKENVVESSEIVDTMGNGHSLLVELLHSLNVDTLICGGIGGGAKTALEEVGIKLYGGVNGNVDETINLFLTNNLVYNPEIKCEHHENEHKNESHKCGENGCGKHNKN